jgi:predicted negative regulator of RcsB-dependent stress response
MGKEEVSGLLLLGAVGIAGFFGYRWLKSRMDAAKAASTNAADQITTASADTSGASLSDEEQLAQLAQPATGDDSSGSSIRA